MFCSQLLQLWFCSHLQHFYRLQTPYHFERHTVKQTVKIALHFTGNGRDWALYLLDFPWVSGPGRLLGGQQYGCPGLIVLSSMECLFLVCGIVQATIPALLFVTLAVFSIQ